MPEKFKETIAGWGNFPKASSYIIHTRNKKDVREAISRGNLVPRGLGRSYGDQAINNDGFVAICTRMNHLISFNSETGVLDCEAGVSLEEIISVFAPQGWMPMICPGTKYVTLGGAIANDIHGKAHHIDGSFVNAIISFTIQLADGREVTASRTENAALFWGNFGGLGLLGFILSVKMQLRKIETTYFRQKSLVIRSLDHMLESLEQYDATYNYSVAWIDPLATGQRLGSGVLTLGNAATVADLPDKLRAAPLLVHSNKKLSVPVYLPDFSLNNVSVRVLNKVIGFVQNSPKEILHYEKFFFPLDMIDNWNRGYGQRGFIQYQFVIPVDEGKKNLKLILESIAQSGCTPFLNVFKKMGKGQGILSFPFEGYTLAIDFPMTSKLPAFIKSLDQKVLAAGGRIYLGKDALLDKETFRKMYPQSDEWLEIKSNYDPANIFTSDISRRLGLHS